MVLCLKISDFSVNSEKITIPRVAKAESHSEISKIEYGITITIIVTDIKRLVTESFELDNRKSKADITVINPALITERGNPVIAI